MKNNLKNIHIYRHIYVNTQLKHFAVNLFLTQNCKSTRLQLKKIKVNKSSRNLLFVDLPYKNAERSLPDVNTRTLDSNLKPYIKIKKTGGENYITKWKLNYYNISCLKSLCLSLYDLKDQGIT